MEDLTRRDFVKSAVTACAFASAGGESVASTAASPSSGEYHVFSRVFQFVRDYDRAADLIRRCGYDGVEWTVRPKGFIEPKDAVRALPLAKRAAQRAGLKADSIVVGFLRGDEPGAEDIVKAAADAGFTSFRGGYFRYDFSRKTGESLDDIKRGFETLARLAEKTGMKATYQNHSSYSPKVPLFGSLVWDLYEVVRNFNPRHIGIQYDIMHAMAEAGPSWEHSLGMIAPYVDWLCLKDFWFEPNPKNSKIWRRHLCPAGEGIVDWKRLLVLCARYGIRAPYTVHFDYDFPSDEAGALKCAGGDLAFYRKTLG